MEIHFYESLDVCPAYISAYLDWQHTKIAIDNKAEEIHTIQMCLLSSSLFAAGYRVFIHQTNGITYELTKRTKENNGKKTVKYSQNMYAMWASDVFRE